MHEVVNKKIVSSKMAVPSIDVIIAFLEQKIQLVPEGT
jgi:hypothetical protein